MGALPVHSDMESVREWITHGVNGLLFPVSDIGALTACIERGLVDEALFSSANTRNWELTLTRLNRDMIRDWVKGVLEDQVIATRENDEKADDRS